MLILILGLIFNLSAYAGNRQINNAKSIEEAEAYLQSLTVFERAKLDKILARVSSSKNDLIPIVTTQDSEHVFLCVRGLGDITYPWYETFLMAINSRDTVYFFRWYKRSTVDQNVESLEKSLNELRLRYPEKKIKVVGYSAGGVLGSIALSKTRNPFLTKKIELHTIASPLQGYSFGKHSMLGSVFAGNTTVNLGIGLQNEIKPHNLGNCHQWITTNCALDIHACDRKGKWPQLLQICSKANIHFFGNDSHTSILPKVMSKILQF